MKTPSDIFPVFIVAMAITGLLMPLLIKLFVNKSLIDRIDHRKIHVRDVPTMGGVGFFLGFLFALFMFGAGPELMAHRFELIALMVMFLVGMRDDIMELSPRSKFIAQMIPAAMLIYFTGIEVHSLYGLFGITVLPKWLAVSITMVFILGMTNSFNLIDGMDGLASSCALVIMACFGAWFILVDQIFYSFLTFAFCGTLVAFIYYNWQPARIFMGDSGALVIGFFISILAIHFMAINPTLDKSSLFQFKATIATTICFLIVPIFDTTSVIIIRLIKKKSPFIADKNHTHHMLMRLGLSHAQISLVITGFNIVFILLAIVLRNMEDHLVLPIILLLAVSISLLLNYLIFKKSKSQNTSLTKSFVSMSKSDRRAS